MPPSSNAVGAAADPFDVDYVLLHMKKIEFFLVIHSLFNKKSSDEFG